MPNKLSTVKEIENKSEYIVEFECYSKLLVTFEEATGLNQLEIVSRAALIANDTFDRDGVLITERIAKDHSYAVTAMGIDSTSANILTPTNAPKSHLKVIK